MNELMYQTTNQITNNIVIEKMTTDIQVNDQLWNDIMKGDPLMIGMIMIVSLVFIFIVASDVIKH